MAEPLAVPTPSAPTVHSSACPLDCPDACSLTVQVQDGRVVKLDGSRLNPVTQGYICSKVRHTPEMLYGPERVLYPAQRVGAKGEGRFERISWEEALTLAAERLRAARDGHGGESILPLCYGGSNGLLTQDTLDARLFYRLGASRLARTVCAAPSGRAAMGLYGKMAGVALTDFPAARLIVLWGVNPSASGIHLVPYILEAQRAGAKLLVVDPRRTPLAKKADLHLAPRPGTDLPLALAVLRWLFANGKADLDFLAAQTHGSEELRRRAEEWTLERAAEVCGVPAEDIERFARLYSASAPALVRCGWGLERNRNGGSAVAAVLALPAVAGKFGVRGGGYTLSNSGVWKFDRDAATGEPETATRLVNMNQAGEALLSGEPPVRVLFVYNGNPLATLPEQEKMRRGLLRDDLFTVVFEQVWTDTARYADLVLPATHFLEQDEMLRGYGSYALFRSRPVAAAAGEARSNNAVFGALVHRLGLDRSGDAESDEELAAALLRPYGRQARELESDGISGPDFGTAPIQLVDVFPLTADGKIHLVPEALDREAPFGLYGFQPDPRSDAYPLALVSPASHRTISSTFGSLVRGPVPLEIHPADAAARGIAAGDEVRVWNQRGEVRVPARLSPDLRRGVVLLPKGLWSRHTLSGTTANALVPDTLADLGGGACFNDARVEVAKV
jgi:anaerobic selenocysteine-containing dehydrogenase